MGGNADNPPGQPRGSFQGSESEALFGCGEAAPAHVTNISGNYELRSAFDQVTLRQQQEQQSYYASHPRTP
jgi:hypothetical protein